MQYILSIFDSVKLTSMKKYFFILPVFLILTLISGCNNYGTEKTFDGVELYHTDKVTAAEADKLGQYLVDQKFADGSGKSVQLTKSGNVYQFRFVVKDGIDKDAAYAKTIKFFGSMLSAQVFDGAPAEVQLCDDHFTTLKTIPADNYGKEKIFNGLSLLHTPNITDVEVDSLGNFLVSSKFADGKQRITIITKVANVYQFKFAVKPGMEKSTDYLKEVKVFAAQISTGAFHGALTEIVLCDDDLNALVAVPMDQSATKM